MFKVGDTVRIKNLKTFHFVSGSSWRNLTGKVIVVDESDDSVQVDFGFEIGQHWFLTSEVESEVESEMTSFESVGKAVEYLISQGFKVTIEKA